MSKGEEAGKLFALMLKEIQAELTVSSITTVSGSLGWILDR